MRFDDDPTPRGLVLMGDMDGFGQSRVRATAEEMTEGQKARLLRDAAVTCLCLNGFSQNQVARIFGLSKARVNAITKRIRGRLNRNRFDD